MNKLDLEETTRRFHNVYEQVAKEYGYKTREDTKELDFNSPNGMTMLKTVETITTPYLEEIERLNNIINNIVKYAWVTDMSIGEFNQLYRIAYNKAFDGDFEKIEEGM